jgi:DNA-binding NarL/FixJ family response regulator
MIAFFEDSNYFYQLEDLLHQNKLPAKGWRNYNGLIDNLRCAQPKVALLDMEIDGNREAGLEALAIITEKFPRIKTIVLTGHPEYVLRAFRAGADGYLLKEEVANSIQYLEEVIADVTHGKIFMSCEVRKIIVESLMPFENIELNTREKQIISLAASDKSCPQIAEMLKLKAQTVETYFKNIKIKMSCHTIQGVVAKAIRNNMVNWEALTLV